MTPAEIVANLDEGSTRRTPAFAALKDLLETLAHHEIPEVHHRDEIVGRVLLKLCELVSEGRLSIRGQSDGECRGYFRTMVHNAWISECRRRRRLDRGDPIERLANQSAPEPAPSVDEVHGGIAFGRELLERVFAFVLEGTPPRYRDSRGLAWKQINELVFERAELKAIVRRDDGLGDAPEPAALQQAINRAFTNHKRVRQAMAGAIPAMVEAGRLSLEDAEMSVHAVEALIRCQRRNA